MFPQAFIAAEWGQFFYPGRKGVGFDVKAVFFLDQPAGISLGVTEIIETDRVQNDPERVLFVFDHLRGEHFPASMAEVILNDLEFILLAAVLDDLFALAIGAAVHVFVDDRFCWFVAPPEQVEAGADFLELA